MSPCVEMKIDTNKCEMTVSMWNIAAEMGDAYAEGTR